MVNNWIIKLRKEQNIMRIYFALITIIYLVTYFKFWVNGTAPPAWQYWFDQSKYYESATSLLKLNFSPGNHFYPLGYQIAALIPVLLLKQHGYGLLNLVLCLITFYFVFKIIRIYCGALVSAFIALLLYRYDSQVTFELVTPWTNNIVFTFYAAIAFLFLKNRINKKIIIYIGLLYGGILLSRPSDIIYLLPIYLSILIKLVNHKKYDLVGILVGVCVVVTIFFALIQFYIYGNLMSPYMMAAKDFTFNFTSFDQKIFSLLFGGKEAFLTDDPMLFSRFPWLVLYPVSIIYFFRHKQYNMLLVQISTLFGFLYAISFAPMMPPTLRIFEGMRMLVPFIIFMGAGALIFICKFIERRNLFDINLIVASVFVYVLVNLHIFGIIQKEIRYEFNEIIENGRYYIAIKSDKNFAYKQIYLIGLNADDLAAAHSDRTIQIEDQSGCFKSQQTHLGLSRSWGVAIPLISHRSTSEINFSIDSSLMENINDRIIPVVGNTEFCFLCNDTLSNTFFVENFSENNELNGFQYNFFGKSGVNSKVAKMGWSVKQETHTWSIGNHSELLLPRGEKVNNHILKLQVSSFGDQSVVVFLNGKVIDSIKLKEANGFQEFDVILPKDLLNYNEKNLLRFEYSNPKSPKKLGLNSDVRNLAMAIKSIKIISQEPNSTLILASKNKLQESKLNGGLKIYEPNNYDSINWKEVDLGSKEIKFPVDKKINELIIQANNSVQDKFAKIIITDNYGKIAEVNFNCIGDSVRFIKLRSGTQNNILYIHNPNQDILKINKIGIR
jgi:hypothetical protein